MKPGSENAPPRLVLPGGFSFDHSKTEDSERQLRSLAGLAHLQLAANVFESLSIRYVPGDKPFVMVNERTSSWPHHAPSASTGSTAVVLDDNRAGATALSL